ncbi:MAG: guanylate kinase [Kiritimatiellae bacterium]|nr:guanylate kinase [Kiritimatiellia bacterium]
MIKSPQDALLLVIAAPSGAGKTTLCNRLLDEIKHIVYSVSCTTRPPRKGEIDGKHYNFLTESAFRERVARGEFLEHAVVHGHLYGTLRKTVDDALRTGHDVLMDIDVQGAAQIRDYVSRAPASDPLRGRMVDIFIAPPSFKVLQDRLHGRAADTSSVIQTRLHNAEQEMARWRDFTYLIVNDDLDESYATLAAIVRAEHQRIR